jgi:hypothetical protein
MHALVQVCTSICLSKLLFAFRMVSKRVLYALLMTFGVYAGNIRIEVTS